MHGDDFDALTRTTGPAITIARRRVAGGILAVAVTLGFHRSQRVAKAKKNKSKCSKRCEGFAFCFNRAADSRLCAQGYNVDFSDCSLCTSDQGCVDTPYPYCMKSFTSVATNTTNPVVTCDGVTGSRCVSLFLA